MTGVEGGGRKRKQVWKRWQNKVKSNQFKGTQTEGKKDFDLGECAHIQYRGGRQAVINKAC